MKIFLAVFLCLFFGFNVFGQTDSNENKEEITVEEISLARDDGKGNVSEATNNFTTTDVPIHCFVGLNSTKSVNVKMIFVAVKTETLRPETKVVTVSYKTSGKQDGVNFNASPETTWAAGAYRVDVFIDGKLSKSLEFEIKKSAKEVVKEKPAQPKSKDKPQTKPKSRKT
jgi:hypothetical protein